jgi:hypothetical protein
MNLLIEKELELDLSIHPANLVQTNGSKYVYTNKLFGHRGSTGPVGYSEKYGEPIIVSHPTYHQIGKCDLGLDEAPQNIRMIIKFKSEQGLELAPKLLNSFSSMGDDGKVWAKYDPPLIVRKKLRAKDQYDELIHEIETKNQLLKIRFEKICAQIDEMGCSYDMYGGPNYQEIPDDYYEWQEHTNYNSACISMYCNCQTKVYEWLKTTGLLHKYFKWPNVCVECNSAEYCLS